MKNGLIVGPNGTKCWYQNDQLHRTDGPAMEWSDGTKEWYQNDQRHRIDGPAIEYPDGTKLWHLNDQLHRIDGPAFEWSDGTKEWYVGGEQIEERNLERAVKEWQIQQVIES